MEDPDSTPQDDRLDALDERIKAAEKRHYKAPVESSEKGAAMGYQVLGELLGGILGGLGLGWLCDNYLGSKPFGMIAGVILGLVASVYLIARRAR